MAPALSPLPLGERVDASVASGRERGPSQNTPLPPRSRFAFARHPLPQGERGNKKCTQQSSSRDLPGGAVLGVLEHDAHGGELVADAVGFFEVFGSTSPLPRLDERRDLRFVDRRAARISLHELAL